MNCFFGVAVAALHPPEPGFGHQEAAWIHAMWQTLKRHRAIVAQGFGLTSEDRW